MLAVAKNRAGKAFRGPKHCSETSRGLSAVSRESRGPVRLCIGCSLHRRNARAFRTDIDGQLLHSIHLHLTPSKVEFRCKLGGCYDDDSSSAPRVSRPGSPACPYGLIWHGPWSSCTVWPTRTPPDHHTQYASTAHYSSYGGFTAFKTKNYYD